MKNPVKSHLLTQEKASPILGRGNDVGQVINKSAINKLQSVAWKINEEILPYLNDTLKPSEEPLGYFEEQERIKSYKLRDIETNQVIDYLLENGNKFWFGWKYDKRGRSYSQGYHINPQGNEYRKAMLSFHEDHAEMLTEDGIRYLKIDIANTMGYDKLQWYSRVSKANKIINDIFASNILNEEKMLEYAEKADSPQLFIKAILAWYNGVVLGKPISHNMGLDSTASGLQYLSALSGCTITAQNCNVHPKIQRTYTEEAQAKLEALEEELAMLG